MSYRRSRRSRRRRKRNPTLGDINTTTEIIIAGVVVFGVVYFGKEIFGAIGSLIDSVTAPFKAVGQAAAQGVQAVSAAQTANTGATGNEVLDSLSVGAAGGG